MPFRVWQRAVQNACNPVPSATCALWGAAGTQAGLGQICGRRVRHGDKPSVSVWAEDTGRLKRPVR